MPATSKYGWRYLGVSNNEHDPVPYLLPIIGPFEAVAGLHITAGFSGHGFGLGPGAVECEVQQLSIEMLPFDIKPIELTSFFDDRKLATGTTL